MQDYRAGEGSIYALANKYGIHRQTVALYLKDYGLALGRLPFSDGEIQRALELRGLGWSANRIGRTMGRDPKTVRSALPAVEH